MNKAENILSEVLRYLEGTVDLFDVQYVISKGKGLPHASEQVADGEDRAQRAVALLVEDLKNHLPPSEVISQFILKVSTSLAFPLLMKEQVIIMRELLDFVGSDLPTVKFVVDQRGTGGSELRLSLVYWVNTEE